jgi:hypothetical protein
MNFTLKKIKLKYNISNRLSSRFQAMESETGIKRIIVLGIELNEGNCPAVKIFV